MQREILQYLLENENEIETDLLVFLIKKYPKQNDAIYRYTKFVIAELLERKFITFYDWDRNLKILDDLSPKTETQAFQKLQNDIRSNGYVGMLARITLEGKKELKDWELKFLTESTNKFSKHSTTISIGLAILVLITQLTKCHDDNVWREAQDNKQSKMVTPKKKQLPADTFYLTPLSPSDTSKSK